jgi:hypothetical protein
MHGPQALNFSLGLDEFVALVAVAAASGARFGVALSLKQQHRKLVAKPCGICAGA